MEEKKLSYSVHIHGDLEKAISCPVGIYYVDFKNQLFYFEPKDGLDPKPAEMTAKLVSILAAGRNIKVGKEVMAIHETCERLKPEHIKKDGDKRSYDFYVQGEMDLFVEEPTLGGLYGDYDKEVFFFEPKHKGFMIPILKKKFFEGIAQDLDSKDGDRKAAAIAVGEIHEKWTELDEEDIVR